MRAHRPVSIESLGWRTDVTLRELEGAAVDEREDHWVIRTPANPGYGWGNFLLLRSPPGAGELERWIGRFQSSFPAARYVAIGIDSPSGDLGASSDDALAAGLSIDLDAVLTARALRAPERTPARTRFRRIESDRQWVEAMSLRLLAAEDDDGPSYREFLEREMHAIRRVCERGRGAWFGAFENGEIRSSLGIFDACDGVARFQSVDTHPQHRRRGFAGNLLFLAGEWARAELRARTLVIAADPDDVAIGLYRSLGFREHERKAHLSRVDPPSSTPSATP